MKRLQVVLTGVALLLVSLSLAGEAAEKVGVTTLEDQVDVAVTVYNNDRALVRDRRLVHVPVGEVALKFMDVAEGIQPETVSLKSLSSPGGMHILEQNYEYDLMTPEKLMEKYVGRKVRLVNVQDKQQNVFDVEATLLSMNNGAVYQVGEDIYLGHPGQVVLPDIPEELIAKPSLIWLLQNDTAEQKMEATYLTGGMSWRADYVLVLARDERSMHLDGWVTLSNRSGATYRNAQLKLVAGEVNVVRDDVQMEAFGGARMMMKSAPAPMREESFAEYHLYTLPRRTTIKQNQSKQVSLLAASDVAIEKVYEYRGNMSFYSQRIPQRKQDKVGVFLKFRNEEENHLGMPLPAGVMRVYQEDREGMLQFSGEDRLEHTPKDETVRLRLGNAFDVVGERVQKDFKRIADTVYEAEFEITLRNHKEEDVVVDVVEPMPADWKILKASQKHEKKDAHTAIFHVPVKADGETMVHYRVRVTY